MAKLAVLDPDHHRTFRGSLTRRIKKAKPNLLDNSACFAVVQSNARDLRFFQRLLQILEAAGLAFSRAGPEFFRREFVDDRAHAAVVVDPRVRHHKIIDLENLCANAETAQ